MRNGGCSILPQHGANHSSFDLHQNHLKARQTIPLNKLNGMSHTLESLHRRITGEMSTSRGSERRAPATRVRELCAIALVALVALQFACHVQCQFFTKANQKSIPRMGRRSAPEPAAGSKTDAYRRLLIDRLVDEFGPDLLAQLRPEIKVNPDAGAIGGEIYLRNEQPFDANFRLINGADNQQQVQAAVEQQQQQMMMTRDERASAGSDGAVARQNFKDSKSLAVRAFNADRLLRHLAQGGSPVVSYDSLVEPKEPRNSAYD